MQEQFEHNQTETETEMETQWNEWNGKYGTNRGDGVYKRK